MINVEDITEVGTRKEKEVVQFFSDLNGELNDLKTRVQYVLGNKDTEVTNSLAIKSEELTSLLLIRHAEYAAAVSDEEKEALVEQINLLTSLYVAILRASIEVVVRRKDDITGGAAWDKLFDLFKEQVLTLNEIDSQPTITEVFRGVKGFDDGVLYGKPVLFAAVDDIVDSSKYQGNYRVAETKNLGDYGNGDVIASVTGITAASAIESSVPDGLAVNSTTGEITVSDSAVLKAGGYKVQVTTTDAFGGTTKNIVDFTIDPDNNLAYAASTARKKSEYINGDSLATITNGTGIVSSVKLASGIMEIGVALNASTGEFTVSNTKTLKSFTRTFEVEVTDIYQRTLLMLVDISVLQDDPVDIDSLFFVEPVKSLESYSNGDTVASFSDVDGGITASAVTTLPGWLSLNSTTGELTISDTSPSSIEPGRYVVNIKVTDSESNVTINPVEFVIGEAVPSIYYNVSAPKIVTAYVDTDTLASLNDTTNVAMVELAGGILPDGTSLNSGTGAITVTDSTLLKVGLFPLDLYVTMNDDTVVSRSLELLVLPDSVAEYSLEPPASVTKYVNGEVIGTVSDPDGDITAAVVTSGSLPAGVSLNAVSGELTVSDASLLVEGMTTFRVKTTDEQGGETTHRVTLIFNPSATFAYTVKTARNVDSYENGDLLAAIEDKILIINASVGKGVLPRGVRLDANGEVRVQDESLLQAGYYENIQILVTQTDGTRDAINLDLEFIPDQEAIYTIVDPKDLAMYSNGEILGSVTDPDGDVIKAEIINGELPIGIALDSTNGNIYVKDQSPPINLVASESPLTIKTTDETGGETLSTFVLAIGNVSRTRALPWDSIKAYQTGEYVERLGNVYRAVQNNKSYDPAIDVALVNWTPVIVSTNNFGIVWQAGDYLQGQVVLNPATNELYILVADTSTAPYASTNLSTEITAGDWVLFNNHTLQQTLAKGNTTGANIINHDISSGKVRQIGTGNVGEYTGPTNYWYVENDNDSFSKAYISMSDDKGSVGFGADQINAVNGGVEMKVGGQVSLQSNTASYTTTNVDKKNVVVAGRNASNDNTKVNSVILGGNGVSIDKSNYAFAENLEIQSGIGIYTTDPTLHGSWGDRAIPDKKYVDDTIGTAITGNLNFKGNYDASTDTPALDTPGSPNTILKGDFYVVTVAGTFFTEALDVGDSLIAKVNAPTALTDWVRVEANNQYSLSKVLGVGNTTGANDIVISNDQVIKAASGGGQINVRTGANNNVEISTDNGTWAEGVMYLSATESTLANYATGSTLNLYGDNFVNISSVGGGTFASLKDGENINTLLGLHSNYGIVIQDNSSNASIGLNINSKAVHVGGNSPSTAAGIVNAVTIGGSNLAADKNAYTFVENLEVQGGIAAYSVDPTTSGSWGDRSIPDKAYIDNKTNPQSGSTTDATETTLTGSKSITSNSVVSFRTRITAIQTAGAAGTVGDVWVHEFIGSIKNIAGTTAIVGDITEVTISEDAGSAAWVVSIMADDTSDELDIKVTGEASKTISWRAETWYNEVTY